MLVAPSKAEKDAWIADIEKAINTSELILGSLVVIN